MEEFIKYINLIAGLWLISVSLILHTSNFISATIFKVVPFFLGGALLFVAGKLFNLI